MRLPDPGAADGLPAAVRSLAGRLKPETRGLPHLEILPLVGPLVPDVRLIASATMRVE